MTHPLVSAFHRIRVEYWLTPEEVADITAFAASVMAAEFVPEFFVGFYNQQNLQDPDMPKALNAA